MATLPRRTVSHIRPASTAAGLPGILLPIVLVCSALLQSCGGGSDAPQARATFEEFQACLRAGDRPRVRSLLTQASREVVPHLPWATLASSKPLTVVSVRPDGASHLIHVRDPNEGNRESTYVVSREDGHHRIDLIRTAGFNHRNVALEGPAMRYTQKELEQHEIDEAVAREASFGR